MNGWLREKDVKESKSYKESLKAKKNLSRQQLKKQKKTKHRQRRKAIKAFFIEIYGKTIESIAKGITKGIMS